MTTDRRGRPKLPVGTWGTISVQHVGPSRYKARARFRTTTGTTIEIARTADTKGRARTKLLEALAEARADTRQITRDATIADLADQWLTADHHWAANTAETYRHTVTNQIKPRLGELPVSELRPPVVNQVLTRIRAEHGPGAAKTTKTVLSGLAAHAVAHGALDRNPVREVGRIPRPRTTPRALTREQADELCDKLRTDPRAVDTDIPDLVDWMLGTGCRIGEALAARYGTNPDGMPLIDTVAGTWEVNATLIRERGRGLVIQPRPKTAAGWRVLALPPSLVLMLARRDGEIRFRAPQRVVFPSPRANKLRDPRNTARDLREAVTRAGYPWVHGHTLRKSALTWLLDAKLPARVVADIAGHTRPSMTLDVYQHRQVVSADAAKILDR